VIFGSRSWASKPRCIASNSITASSIVGSRSRRQPAMKANHGELFAIRSLARPDRPSKMTCMSRRASAISPLGRPDAARSRQRESVDRPDCSTARRVDVDNGVSPIARARKRSGRRAAAMIAT
jgi:hypothetical protein